MMDLYTVIILFLLCAAIIIWLIVDAASLRDTLDRERARRESLQEETARLQGLLVAERRMSSFLQDRYTDLVTARAKQIPEIDVQALARDSWGENL